MADKTVVTFSPELGQAIADYVKDAIRNLPAPKTLTPNGRVPSKQTVIAKITGHDGTNPVRHSWKEQHFNSTSQAYEDMPQGREGHTDFDYAVNTGNPTAILPDNTILGLVKTIDVSDPATNGGCWSVSGGALPVGQYPGMVYQTGSNDSPVFDWARYHPLIPS